MGINKVKPDTFSTYILSEKLYHYYFLVDEINRVETKYNAFCETMEEQIHLQGGVMKRIIQLFSESRGPQIELESSLTPPPLEALFIRGPFDVAHILRKYNELMRLGTELLREMIQIFPATGGWTAQVAGIWFPIPVSRAQMQDIRPRAPTIEFHCSGIRHCEGETHIESPTHHRVIQVVRIVPHS